jgi:hypothetical protein
MCPSKDPVVAGRERFFKEHGATGRPSSRMTPRDWLRFFVNKNQNPDLSAEGKERLKRALRTLASDGVDLDSICPALGSLKRYPKHNPSTTLSKFSTADQRRIKALPKNLRAIAALLGKDGFPDVLLLGALRVPSLCETINHLGANEEGMIPMRDGRRRGTLFVKLPEILEDVAQAIEMAIQRRPQVVTFAFRVTSVFDKIAGQSRSKREHYQEILDILDPERKSPMTYDALKRQVLRERVRWKKRSPQRRPYQP